VSEAPFLQQLALQPDDNVLRLVYADWLEERDDPRGPFLRAAVMLQSLGANDEQVPHLRHRILELRPKVSAGWLVRVLHAYAADDVREAVFRRGGGPEGFHEAMFLGVDHGDPSWYLLDRLLPDFPELCPMSKGCAGEERLPGTRYMFDDMVWRDETRCEIDFGIVIMPLDGTYHCHHAELQGEQWVITDLQKTWIF
jgi:uncharacterized protein (TIGR02996 family)